MSYSKSLTAELSAARLPSDIAPRLGAIAAACQDHEPFVVHLLSDSELAALEGCHLIERGPSGASAVGDSGYRLTRRGWEVVALLWYDRGPQAREPGPVIPAG